MHFAGRLTGVWQRDISNGKTVYNMHNAYPSILQTWTIRLKPGDDLKKIIDELARDYSISAGVVVTCVGSSTKASIRFRENRARPNWKVPLEIVSLTGMISTTVSHLHISLSDKTEKPLEDI